MILEIFKSKIEKMNSKLVDDINNIDGPFKDSSHWNHRKRVPSATSQATIQESSTVQSSIYFISRILSSIYSFKV